MRLLLSILILCTLVGVLPVAATSQEAQKNTPVLGDMPTNGEETAAARTPQQDEAMKDYAALRELIPADVLSLLPDSFFSSDPYAVAEGVRTVTDPAALLSLCAELLLGGLLGAISLLFRIGALLLLSALVRSLAASGKGGTADAVGLLVTLLAVLLIFGEGGQLAKAGELVSTLATLVGAMLPLMGTLLAMGGNISAAVANSGVLSAFLAIATGLCAKTLLPTAGVCLVLSLVGAVGNGPSLAPISRLVKRTYTLFISFLMLLLCGILGLQTVLAKGTDTLALRTARFAAGSFLPVVGGSVGEALRTVAAGVGLLRSVVGSAFVVVLFLVFLPPFLAVMLERLAFMLAGALAGVLGLDKEGAVLAELASVYGYVLAVLASLFVMTVFALTLFARAATAI